MAQLRDYTGNNTVGTISMGSLGFPTEGEMTFLLAETVEETVNGPKRLGDHPTYEDLLQTPLTILGYTSTEAEDGRIFRELPFRHPLYGRLFAYKLSCTSMTEDLHQPQIDVNVNPDTPSSGPFALHRNYLYKVQYHIPSFPILPNRSIKTSTLTWYDVDGSKQITPNVANEWLRYTDAVITDREDIITATVGLNSKFRTGTSAPPFNTEFTSQTSMRIPNRMLKVWFFDAPYRYWTSPNSFMRRLNGRINQFPIFDYDAGELLYQGATYTRYDKNLDIPDADNDVLPTQDRLNFNKLATFVFTFIVAEGRVGSNLPVAGGLLPSNRPPTNLNYIYKTGHNLQPWLFDKKYYYVSQDIIDPITKEVIDSPPSFYSAPMEFLFCDPDVVEV